MARKPTRPDLSSLAGGRQDAATGPADNPAPPFDDLDDLGDPDDLDDLGDLDDEEFLAALDEEDREAAEFLREILGKDLPSEVPQPQRANATEALRVGVSGGGWPYDWFARSLSWEAGVPNDLDEEAAWLIAAGSVVSPPNDPGWDPESVAAVLTLTHADWVGAVVAVVRQGSGADASPQALVRTSALVPEIEGELEYDSIALVEHAFELVTPLWQALGAVDEDRRVTALGCWGLPRALWLTWRLSGLSPENLGLEPTDTDVGADDEELSATERELLDNAAAARQAFVDWQSDSDEGDDARARTAAAALSEPNAAAWLHAAVPRSDKWDPFLRWAFHASVGTPDASGPAMFLAVRAEWAKNVAEEEKWLAAALTADPRCQDALWRSADYAGDRGDAATAYDLLRRAGIDDDDDELATYARFRFPPVAVAPRNAPCPCGSGRKYKHCHGGQRIGHPLTERAGWLLAKVGRFVQRPPQRDLLLGYGARRADTEEVRSGAAAQAVLSEPFVTDCAIHDGGGLADFLAERGDLLPADERPLAEAWLDSRRGLFEVIEVNPGSGMRLRDLDDDREYDVLERRGSREAHRGDLLLSRLLDNGSEHMLGSVMMIPRLHRGRLSAALRSGSAEDFLDWLSSTDRLPELRNTEDQALILCTQSWRLSSPTAWQRLRKSGLSESGPEELVLTRPDGTLVGTFSRAGLEVEISSNSRERQAELVDLLRKADPEAELVSSAEQSGEQMLRTPRAVPDPVEPAPDVAQALAEHIRAYERTWIDTEIPALGGKTPRVAMRSPTSRRELQLLLEDFDAMPTPAGGGGMSADRIRGLLGLPPGRA